MKLIHCSDFHLDSALGSHFPPAQAKLRNAEICATFGRLVSYAQAEQVAAVLIAGDLFDSPYAAHSTVDYALEKIRGAKSVTFFYLRGNHDGKRDAFDGCELPDNLKCFGSEWTSYTCGDVRITGRALPCDASEDIYASLQLSAQDCNIVMLHGELSAQAGPEQIALPRLRNQHIDYLALGHIHSFRQGRLDERGIYCYCGCTEGRGFDECGEKGFVLLETAAHGIQSRFVPFARRRLHDVEVDITSAETVTQLLSRMKQAAAQIPREDLVKFTLRGAYTAQTQKDIPFLQKLLEEDFYLVKIKDESRLELNRENYEFDISLKGEFIRLVLASDLPEEEKERVIDCGIRALSGEEVVR